MPLSSLSVRDATVAIVNCCLGECARGNETSGTAGAGFPPPQQAEATDMTTAGQTAVTPSRRQSAPEMIDLSRGDTHDIT
jgi:hypothetical protein